MNKTISINIAGIVFHIEEEAYEKLKKYLGSVKQYFKGTEGSEEIIADIEARIAELLHQYVGEEREVVLMSDIDAVIAEMGQPKDFLGAEEEEAAAYEEAKIKKRFFRDPDDKVLGGVSSGIAAYFDIDPLWIRLALVLLTIFTWGGWIVVYIILWAIIPEAKTRADKMAMRGEKFTISSIEKNVKDEVENIKKKFDEVTDEAKQAEYGKRVQTGFQRLVDFVVSVVVFLFKFLVKLIGVILIIIGIAFVIAFLSSLFGFTSIGDFSWSLLPIFFGATWKVILTVLAFFLVIGIPVISFLYLGIKILFNVKTSNHIIGKTLFGLWVIGIIMTGVVAASTSVEFRERETIEEQMELHQLQADTIYMDVFRNTETRTKFGFGRRENIVLNKDHYYLDNIRFTIEKSPDNRLELVKTVTSEGPSEDDALAYARAARYPIEIGDSSKISFPDYFVLDKDIPFRGQELRMILYVPEGKTLYLSPKMKKIIYNIDDVHDMYDNRMVGHFWQMKREGLTCLDCYKKNSENKIIYEEAKVYTLDSFSKINISHAFKVRLIQGDEYKVVVHSDDEEAFRDIEISVIKGKLVVESEEDKWIDWNIFSDYDEVPLLEITLPEVDEIEFTGAIKAESEHIRTEDIKIELTGASKLDMSIEARNVSLEASGASEITLGGETQMLEIELVGASDLDAGKLKSQRIKVRAAGASKARVYATEKLDAEAVGASSVRYLGNPEVASEAFGASSVKRDK